MSIKQAQGPDIEGNSVNGLPDGNLPQGSSIQGMTEGAHQGLTQSEVYQGYESLNADGTKGMKLQREGDELGFAPTQSGGGFVGRPGGWER